MTKKQDETFFQSAIWGNGRDGAKRVRPKLGTHREAARDISIFKETDVLVIGGGPSGTSAAISASRLGADVTLVERYNHLGGLSTGGLVIWIDRMTDWSGQQVICGIANDLLDRLPADAKAGPPRDLWGSQDEAHVEHWRFRTAAFKGTVTWSPTIDPEWLKLESMRMVQECGVDLLFHAWAAEPIYEDNVVKGAIFESKEGRMAITAKVVVDCSGDGDMYARAGAPYESDVDDGDIHHCMNTSWMFGGVDMEEWLAFRSGKPTEYSDFMKKGREAAQYFDPPFVSWRKDVALFMGPRLSGYSPLSVDDLTEVEALSRSLMAKHLAVYREHAPGFKNAFLMLSAPQMGARHARRLVGANAVLRAQWDAGTVFADEIGVSPSLGPQFPNISIPYGCLVPERLDGILAAGRHIACDSNSHAFLREIPQCWVTGQAAGVAAAVAANSGVRPRDVDVGAVQKELLRQGAFVRDGVAETEQIVVEAAAGD